MSTFIDRAAALVEERRSQVCLGLDPDPAEVGIPGDATCGDPGEAAETTAQAVVSSCIELIESVGSFCVAVKPQLACFERLGSPGFRALEQVCAAARDAGLLVVADGKRGDVPVSARAYGQALTGGVETPAGRAGGLGADAFTVNPYTGLDTLETFIEAAEASGAGIFALVRTSNPGAADFQDLDCGGLPLFERVAQALDGLAPRLGSDSGDLSGVGAVVGATEPQHLSRLRELLPRSIFLIPGVGAQGGRPEDLGPAFLPGRAAALVAASRSIASAPDPAAAARDLRDALWEVSGASDQTT